MIDFRQGLLRLLVKGANLSKSDIILLLLGIVTVGPILSAIIYASIDKNYGSLSFIDIAILSYLSLIILFGLIFSGIYIYAYFNKEKYLQIKKLRQFKTSKMFHMSLMPLEPSKMANLTSTGTQNHLQMQIKPQPASHNPQQLHLHQ